MGPGGVAGAAAQFQRMGIQGTADLPRPTIRPAANFSAERDTDIIRKAMKGMGKFNPNKVDFLILIFWTSPFKGCLVILCIFIHTHVENPISQQ